MRIPKEFPVFILENWNHFLVDCETALGKNKVLPQELSETLNSVNEAIQLTMEFSDKEIPFLDILIKRDSSGIWMNLYHKPTDTQRCLSYCTSHPKHYLKNIPFVMARRIHTIVDHNSIENSGGIEKRKRNGGCM